MGDKTSRSCLEEQMYGYLTALGIPFSEQYPTRNGFVMDFLIELPREDGALVKIDLEVDGSPWHSKRHQLKRDRFRDAVMRNAGYVVLRFREGFTQRFAEEQIHEVARRYRCAIPGSSGE
jgi:very-short-patch-repair endonuclease